MPTPTTVLQLEQARRRKGVSLEQIANSTKISTTFLRAIESEEFEKLPGGVYNANYIRQYAAAIDYSEESLLGQYRRTKANRESSDQGLPPIGQPSPKRWISWLVSPTARP
ncbi:MAG: helix-turn-helix transcriptional regulator [Bryobacteraceae bacterium]